MFYQLQTETILNDNLADFSIVCYSCFGYGHFAIDCKETHFDNRKALLKPKRLMIVTNSRMSVLRVNRRAYQALNELSEVGCISMALETKPHIQKIERKRTYRSQATFKMQQESDKHNSMIRQQMSQIDLIAQKKKDIKIKE